MNTSNMLTYVNYFEKLNENSIHMEIFLDKIYDDKKEAITKIEFSNNITNTSNKNKTFFQYDCLKEDNVQPIPLGVTYESFRNISKITNFEKTILCSSQMSYTGDRESIQTFPFVTYLQKTNNLTYLQNLANSKYVLSPHGEFPDCYRHYESMYLSAIPITIRHPKLYFLEELPVLLLNSWDELTEELLNNSYETILNKSREKLDINYWINIMKQVEGN